MRWKLETDEIRDGQPVLFPLPTETGGKTPKMKKRPDFESEEEEKEFCKTHNPMDYVDWSKADAVVDRFLKKKGTQKNFCDDFGKKTRQ